MSRFALRFSSVWIRGGAVALLFPTFLLAFYLAVAPQLHERLHVAAGSPGHECLVTIFAGANCEYSVASPSVSASSLVPLWEVLAPHFPAFIAARETAVLEHAPPAYS
jgi:hypothetical protein